MNMERKKVVIVGAGFGGLTVAKKLKKANVDVYLIDKNNHHLFQPLLYQVAISALSPGDIASPLRTIMRGHENVNVIMNEVKAIDKDRKKIYLDGAEMEYDFLVLAPGTSHSYFGNDNWADHAPGLKTLNDALEIREQILESFENADRLYGTPGAEKHLTFVIVGGGPTGVELAGAIAEISLKTMIPDFPKIKPEDIKVIMVEAGDSVLKSYPQELSEYSLDALRQLGVDVRLGSPVSEVNDCGVQVGDGFIETENVFWAAGNEVSPLLRTIDARADRSGRVIVNEDCSVPGNPEIFVIGDAASFVDDEGMPLPAVAPVAMQQGEFVSKIIKGGIPAEGRPPFKYRDMGSMATIGRAKAVAYAGTFKLKGFLAWLFWALIHIFKIIEFRNRLSVMVEWIWYYIAYKPGAHLIIRSKKKDQKVKADY